MPRTLHQKLSAFNALLLRGCLWGAMFCLVIMTVITLMQVGARYLFSAPFSWPEEVARILMVWMTFLAMPYAYREGLLVRLESMTARMSERLHSRLEIFVHALLLLMFMLLLKESIWMVQRGSVIRATSVDVSMGWVFSVMPLSFLLLISVAVEFLTAALSRDNTDAPAGDIS